MTASKIVDLVESLNKIGLSASSYRNAYFNDEPRFFNYNTILPINKDFSDGHIKPGEPHGSGVSFFSPTDALSKSIWEAMERFCNYSWVKRNTIYTTGKNKKYEFIDLSHFSKDPKIKSKKMGWIEGFDMFENKKVLLPAQLVYLNYHFQRQEPHLGYPHNSTGSAAGSSKDMAILNGIYEVIERDSLLGIYLNKITPPIVDLKKLHDKEIDYLVSKFKKYNLELYILNSTTDLGVPSFLSLVLDRTGAGPAVGIGAKAGFNVKSAIIGAIGEVLMTRLYTKSMLTKGDISADLKSANGLFPNRAKHWITLDTINKIDFMLAGKQEALSLRGKKMTIKNELKKVLKIIKSKGYKVYFSDCTIPQFKKLDFFTYFTFIPGLQPLYLIENERENIADVRRLSKIANHFGLEFGGINQIPHPFL